jgi:hypothetical protein
MTPGGQVSNRNKHAGVLGSGATGRAMSRPQIDAGIKPGERSGYDHVKTKITAEIGGGGHYPEIYFIIGVLVGCVSENLGRTKRVFGVSDHDVILRKK